MQLPHSLVPRSFSCGDTCPAHGIGSALTGLSRPNPGVWARGDRPHKDIKQNVLRVHSNKRAAARPGSPIPKENQGLLPAPFPTGSGVAVPTEPGGGVAGNDERHSHPGASPAQRHGWE